MEVYSIIVGFSLVQYYNGDPVRLIFGNAFNTMNNFCPYSHYFHLNLLNCFPPRADAQKF